MQTTVVIYEKEAKLIEGYNIFSVKAVRSVPASDLYSIASWQYYSKTKILYIAY